MEARFEKFFTDFFKPEGASNALINEINNRLDFKLPDDYLDVMRAFNGATEKLVKIAIWYYSPSMSLLK